MTYQVFSGYEIRVNAKTEAYCRSALNAAAVLATNALGVGPDDDVDVVLWNVDGDGFRSECLCWAGCGWSCIDYYSQFGMR